MLQQIKTAVLITIVLTVLTGIIYPLAITALSQVLFPSQANGSLIVSNGKVIGSELLGQNFAKPEYFHPRPSAAGTGYEATSSGGSNLGPTSPDLSKRLGADAAAFHKDNPQQTGPLPSDLITASASGLDPDISPASARVQIARVAQARGISPQQMESLVGADVQGRQLGILGEPRVNVLKLNLDIDRQYPLKR